MLQINWRRGKTKETRKLIRTWWVVWKVCELPGNRCECHECVCVMKRYQITYNKIHFQSKKNEKQNDETLNFIRVRRRMYVVAASVKYLRIGRRSYRKTVLPSSWKPFCRLFTFRISNQFKTIGWNYKCESKLILKYFNSECLRATTE